MVDPVTYFGLWSDNDILRVSGLLQELGVRFKVDAEEVLDQERLKSWNAWDEGAPNPHIAHHLWIHDEDVPRLGTLIVDHFPHRFV